MEKIEHKIISTNGINMHIASIGTGPEILFLHGFPELWYSWRAQLLTLSSLGYRCIAPDLRGYGDTDAPKSITQYTAFHIVGDLIGLLDAMGIERVFVVGHDWGAMMAWYFCMFRPDRVKALVNTSVPFIARDPRVKPVELYRTLCGDDFYICRFQEPGEAEKDFARAETGKLIRSLFTSRDPNPPIRPDGFGLLTDDLPPLPSWLSEEDINYYADKFSKKGFTGGLNYYRNMDLNWELMAAWAGVKIKVPVKFIIGDLDIVYNFPGMKDYVGGGRFKEDIPDLQEVVIMEGVAHFINQEKPDEISQHIYDFIKNF